MPAAGEPSVRSLWGRALWHMRWPTVYVCGPLLGLMMVDLFFGLPGRLWPIATGFFGFSVVLLGILVHGEVKRLRRTARSR